MVYVLMTDRKDLNWTLAFCIQQKIYCYSHFLIIFEVSNYSWEGEPEVSSSYLPLKQSKVEYIKLVNNNNLCECKSTLELMIHGRMFISILICRWSTRSHLPGCNSLVSCSGHSSPPGPFPLDLAHVYHSLSLKVKGAQKSKSEQCFLCVCVPGNNSEVCINFLSIQGYHLL